MKKITLFITLIAFTFGFSQSIPITFDSGIIAGAKADGVVSPLDANWFSDSGLTSVSIEDLSSDSPDHGNAGKMVSSVSGQPWQNAQILLQDNYIDLTTNKVITLDVYSDNPQDFLLKMEQSLNGGAVTEKSFSHGGTGWESISVDFSSPNAGQPVPNDQYKLFVIFPCYSASFASPAFDSTTYIDNFSGTVGEVIVVPTGPTTNAPTPTVDAGDVISIYSDAYTDITETNFNPNWGQSTQVNTAYDPTGEGTNTVIEYSNFNYQGTEFPSTDMSAMTKVHFDVWTANEATIQFTPISTGQENLVSVTSTGGTWTSVDLNLASNFANVVLSDIFQLKFVGSGTVYLDNIYFYSTPPTTTVTVDVSESPGGVNIQSNQNGWAEAAAVDNGDGTYSYTFENVAAGTVIEYKWILYTSATGTIEDLVPLVGGGGVDNDLAANLPANETIVTDYTNYCNRSITASTTDVIAQTYYFNSFRQPGVDYPELVVTAPAGDNLVIDYSSNAWSEFHGPGAVDNGDGTHTVLVDPTSTFEYIWVNTTSGVTEDLLTCDNNDANINTDNSTYANRVHVAGEDHNDVFGACPLPEGPTTSAPTPPTRDASDVFSLLSDAYTNETAVVGAFAAATIEDFVIGSTDNTLKVTAPNAGGGYQYVFGIPNGVDLSAFTHMHIDYYAMGEVAGGEVLQTFLQQFAGDGAFQHNIVNTAAVTTTASWVSIDVEISTMGSGELSRDNIGQIQMVLAGPVYGPLFLDNIYFYREATQGLDDNVFNTVKMFPNPAKDTVQFSVNSNENLDIEIFDMLGKSVLRVNDVQNEVNISDLNSGLYFVQMTLGAQQATKKLIIN